MRFQSSIFPADKHDITIMVRLYHPLLFLLARSTSDDLQKQVEFLKAKNELLRNRIPRKRIFLKPHERARLLALGRELGTAIRQIITIVDYSTFRRWVRKEDGLDAKSGRGRPRIGMVIRELVVMMARETGWGYTRILGELRKLGLGRISRQTVKNILRENGFEPGPKRGRGTWSEFLKIHADTLWQVDFFSKRIWTLHGPRQAFAMAFLHVATRRIFVTPSTCRPDAGWMKAQAKAFFNFADEHRLPCEIFIRDHDGKYSSDFDRCFTDRGTQVKPVGPRAPNMNAYIERWIQSLKFEALNHFVVFGLEHFDHICGQYADFYHECRPHQGIGNRLICAEDGEEPPPVTSLDQVRCEERLGGLLKHYYRAA